MGLNQNQARCARGFGRSMAVIAGAGSGKTFTLKERIANAFDPEVTAGQMEPLDSIDQVLAITFTEKAALELKSRVKSTLRARGRVDQALRVDGAWISTIHGMCSRILKENALALGIDPAFRILSEDARATMLDQAIERTLLANGSLSSDVDLLFAEYRRDTLKDMVRSLVDTAVKSPCEFDSLEGPKLSRATSDEVEVFRSVVARYVADREGLGGDLPFVGVAEMSRFLEECGPSGSFTCSDLTLVSWELPWGADDELSHAARLNLCCLMIRQAEAARLWEPLERVARASYQLFCEAKVAGGWFDNNDLLIQANHALSRPDVAARYQDRFRLVMVDEFQDTDQMQLDTIKALAGRNCERLCVVGDPEQSIYRFRGADLAVCTRHLATVSDEAKIKLDDNYRSHTDVLDFVDVAFGDVGGPADYYQRLKAARDESRVRPERRLRQGEGPRIEVIDAEYLRFQGSKARRFLAACIAARFDQMHRATGRPFSHMVILLGKMTHAEVYAKALGDLGIPCAVTGGSVLSKKSDALVMVALTRMLANPRDAEAAAGVLESDVFALDSADLMGLEQWAKAVGGSERLSLGAAFARLVANDPDVLPQRLAEGRLGVAARVMGRAFDRLEHESVARVMELVLAESGWLDRIQGMHADDSEAEAGASVSGQARAADALKVIRMVEDLEGEGFLGPRAVSEALEARLSGTSEVPGVLSAKGSDFVHIMTIHASKGLQFPVCACAELDGVRSPSKSKVGTQTVAGHSYVSVDLQESLGYATTRMNNCAGKAVREQVLGELADRVPYDVLDSAALERLLHRADCEGNAAGRFAALSAYGDEQEAEELERKLYVAFTRAEEALIVCMMGQASATGIRKRLKEAVKAKRLPPDLAAVIKCANSTSKKIAPEEKAVAKEREKEIMGHVCLSYMSSLEGVLGRIRARRDRVKDAGYTYLHAPAAYVERWDATGELPPEWTGGANEDDAYVDFEHCGKIAADAKSEPIGTVPTQMLPLDVPRQRYAPLAQLGVLSASALHQSDMEERGQVMPPAVSFDDEGVPEASATERGTAFHLLGEIAARRWRPGTALAAPVDRIHPTALLYGLNDQQEKALAREVDAWLASPVARAMAEHDHLEPEAPFFVRMPVPQGGRELALTGFIDLLAYDVRDAGSAEVVDYKTGRFLDTDAKRRQAYEVQARTYAYALMRRGFASVRLHFVFVDQPDATGMPTLCDFGPWRLDDLEGFLRGLSV